MLKEMGMPKTKTSRLASKLYDNCGVDHWGAVMPNGRHILTQCKSGYKNSRPKADEEFEYQMKNLKENLPEYSGEFKGLQLLFHKIDGYKPEHHLVTMKYEDFVEIFKVYINNVKRDLE